MQVGLFTREQILAVLEEAERGAGTISDLCRKHNIARFTYYRWRKEYGGAIRPRAPNGYRAATAAAAAGAASGSEAPNASTPSNAPSVQELTRDNAQLKRLLAERDMEVDLLKQAMGKKW